ncbi:hypothetical protein FBR02_06010 [Anaerolineae bacterium CFX9]|nr:hypothetical protein [Anaerolineae bacterium CFX9]
MRLLLQWAQSYDRHKWDKLRRVFGQV